VTNDIEVFVADGERNILAGRMYPHLRRGSESASFIYDDQYLANPGAYQLDPVLAASHRYAADAGGPCVVRRFADSIA